jgi:hypothetical protein
MMIFFFNLFCHKVSILYFRDICDFWGWLKRLLKIPSQPNPGIPIVLRGDLTQSDGDAVLSTTLSRNTRCGQAREQLYFASLRTRLDLQEWVKKIV